MILFFCGAPKHASHFQMFIVQEAMEQSGKKYQQVGNEIFHVHDWPNAKKLLVDLDARRNEIFFCKGHWGSQFERDFLLSFKSIRIFLIWRDLKDVLVSQYYFFTNKSQIKYNDFSDYYWKSGRFQHYNQLAYQKVWEEVSSDPRVFSSSYTDLIEDFHNTCPKLLNFVGLNDVDLEKLKKQLSLEKMRLKHKDPQGVFFRRGIVGESNQIIHSQNVISDMEEIGKIYNKSLNHKILYELKSIKYYPCKRTFFANYFHIISRYLKKNYTLFILKRKLAEI